LFIAGQAALYPDFSCACGFDSTNLRLSQVFQKKLQMTINIQSSIRSSAARGYADHGWLKSFHSFSFADYRDPAHVQFGNLRVINEDRIAPATGFGTHSHRDMEIISYVLAGALGHKDSLGNGTSIVPGDVQRMSAGRGIQHSEFNHAKDLETHFLQIWLFPNQSDIAPSYEQKHFDAAEKRGRLRLVASSTGADGSVLLHADANLYAGLFKADENAELALARGRLCYVHLVRGQLRINGELLQAGDALKLVPDAGFAVELKLTDGIDAEVLVFDLAPN
jgi:quercetin 2,3-dioxygenase